MKEKHFKSDPRAFTWF